MKSLTTLKTSRLVALWSAHSAILDDDVPADEKRESLILCGEIIDEINKRDKERAQLRTIVQAAIRYFENESDATNAKLRRAVTEYMASLIPGGEDVLAAFDKTI